MRNLNLFLSELHKSNLKINKKEVKEVNRTMDKADMIDFWRKLNGERKKYICFSKVHGT